MTRCGSFSLATAFMLAVAGSVCAQPAAEARPPPRLADPGTWTATARNVTRVESWNFFTPPPGGGDPTTAHLGNRLTAGLQWTRREWRVQGQLQYVQMVGLPSNAIGPGPLGTGALYFDHSGRRHAGQVYLRTLTVSRQNAWPGVDVVLGRQAYVSGGEHPTNDPDVERVKRLRLDARLIGDFDWSLFQRAFDGGRVHARVGRWQVTGAAFQPTQGGFEDAAGVGGSDVRLLSAVVALPFGALAPRTDIQGFAHYYADTRAVTGRPDNSGKPATRADIAMPTIGASVVGRYPAAGNALVDVVGWGAWQGGSWYGDRHRAMALALEAGIQWTNVAWEPWIRGAWFRGSGDDDPSDGAHGTFFPVLPTARKYALSTLYTTSNVDDLFAQALLRPSSRLQLRAEVHRLRLASREDHWYAGAGMTQQRGRLFGLVLRPSGGLADLGTAIDAMADLTVHRHLSVNAYVGHIRGGPVVSSSFSGRRLTYAYVESVISY